MKQQVINLYKSLIPLSSYFYVKLNTLTTRSQRYLLIIGGLWLIKHGLSKCAMADLDLPEEDADPGDGDSPDLKFDDLELRKGWCALYALAEGSWGGLITTVSGIGAIVACVSGQYRAGMSFLTVAVSCFCLRSFVSLYFGELDGCDPKGDLNPMKDVLPKGKEGAVFEGDIVPGGDPIA